MNKYLLFSLILISVVIILVLFIELPIPPKSLQKQARQALHQAKMVRAHLLAQNSFNKAQLMFDSATIEWGNENGKLVLFRDYALMESHLEESIVASELSYATAIDRKKQLGRKYESRIETIQDLFSYYNLFLINIPLNSKDKETLTLSKLQLEECKLSINNKSTTGIETKLTEVQETIVSLIKTSKEVLTNYFEEYDKWEKLHIEAIKESKQNKSNVIIVDKLNRLCQVYKQGVLQSTFNTELGANWMGDKQLAGDKMTPEGEYKIIMKKEGNQTKYQKALLLNYPSQEDQKRHNKNKVKGIIPKNSRIGGDIEIHGMGGKGTDWTDGCVALTNQDMDKLFSMVAVGTPVIILGSTKPLNEVLGDEEL
jgi:L,D-peptidoglycan transpeptidase YkuD (ErfK/YbiS/YcfS/YnhG family)